MADKKISALTSATTPLAGSEVFPVVQSATTVKTTIDDVNKGRQTLTDTLLASPPTYPGRVYFGTSGGLNAVGGLEFQYATSGAGYGFKVAAYTISDQLEIGYRANSAAWTKAIGLGIDGNVYIAGAAKGINFTANTPAAGMTSQLLNWYEEGTWTPTIGFSTSNGDLSYSVQVGTYTKIGNICVVQATLTFSETTASGNLRITNLPFTASNQTNITQGFGCYVDGMTGLSGAPVATITNNSTVMNFFYTGTGATSAITNSNTAAGSVIRFSVSYRTL